MISVAENGTQAHELLICRNPLSPLQQQRPSSSTEVTTVVSSGKPCNATAAIDSLMERTTEENNQNVNAATTVVPGLGAGSGSIDIAQTAPIPNCPVFRRAQMSTPHQRHMVRVSPYGRNQTLWSQVLVVLHQPTEDSKHRLAEDIPGVRLHDYMPHGAWLAVGDIDDIHKVSVHPRVRWVGSYSARYRLHPELYSQNHSSAPSRLWAHPLNSSDQVTLFVSILPDVLHPNVTDIASTIAAAQSWQKRSTAQPWANDAEICISASSLEKIVVTVKPLTVFDVSKWLSELASVKWVKPQQIMITFVTCCSQVEISDKIVPHNRNARWLVQSMVSPNAASGVASEPLWHVLKDPNDGSWTKLTGEDQIIAIADTGLDVHNCFFRDETRQVKYSDYSLGAVPSTDGLHCIGPNCHRKIKAYWNYMDDVDEAHGHGTSIAGAAAAGAVTGSPTSLAGFDSTARDAHLLVIDIGCNGNANCSCPDCDCARKHANDDKCLPLKFDEDNSLHPPDDWNARLFPWPYENGAKIFVAAWGDTGPLSVYSSHAGEIDKFTWEHQDFLPIFSAGNDGEQGFNTISPAATAKNALTVGSTGSNYGIWKSNAPYWDLSSEAILLRDKLVEEHCSCGACQSEDCQKVPCAEMAYVYMTLDVAWQALSLVPHWANNSDDCCTNSLASTSRTKCCPAQFNTSLENTNFFYSNELSGHNLQSTSSRGPTTDNRIKPDIVVIGEQVVSAKAGSATNANGYCATTSTNDQCSQDSGTSMAAGVAASMAAATREYLVKGFFPSGQREDLDGFEPTAALVKAILIAGAVKPAGMVDLNGKGNWAKFSDGTVSPKDISDGFDGRSARWAFGLADPQFALRSAGWPGTYGPSYFYGFGRLEAGRSLIFRRSVAAKMHLWIAGDSVPATTDCQGKCRGPYYLLVSVQGVPGREKWLLGEDMFCPSEYKNANLVVQPQLGASLGLTYCLQAKIRKMSNYANKVSIGTGEAHARCLRVGGNTKDVVIVLVWTDYPASASSAMALVNDLDLEVIFNGNILAGNAKTQRKPTTGAINQGYDRNNNVERVVIPQGSFEPGTSFMIVVRGYNIPQGPQRYALSVTGEDVYNVQENIEDQSGVHALPTGAYPVCPECVTGTRRPCDEFNKYYAYGTVSDQRCNGVGTWSECLPYKCLRGFVITRDTLGQTKCEKWLDEKVAGQSTDEDPVEDPVASRRQPLSLNNRTISELMNSQATASLETKVTPDPGASNIMAPNIVGPLLPESARFMHNAAHLKSVQEHDVDQLHQYFAVLKNSSCVTAVEQLAGKHLHRHSHTLFYLTLNTSAALSVSASPCLVSMEPYSPERRVPYGRIPQPRAAAKHYELMYIRPAHKLEAASVIEKWKSLDGFHRLNATIQAIDSDEILARVQSDHLKSLVEWLIHQPEVRWVEQHTTKVIRSNYIRWISQSNIPTIPEGTGETPYSDINLDGEFIGDFDVIGDPPGGPWKYQGEIYAVADTGIDYQHCMLVDEKQQTPLMVDEVGNTLVQSYEGHRKITAYWRYMDDEDDIDGHGTHTCSLIAGSLERSGSSILGDFAGLTPKAKIYFMDIGCSKPEGCECTDCDCLAYGDVNGTATCPPSTTAIHVPFNFYKEDETGAEAGNKKNSLLHWALMNAVDVIVLPWGANTTDQVYGREATDLDQFIWNQQTQSLNNPQITVIVAAGDDGLDTAYSGIRGAALAKNAIVVGASETSPAAYKQAVEQFCNQGAVYDSVRLAEFADVKRRLKKEYCSCEINHYDPDREIIYTGFYEPAREMCRSQECATVTAMATPDDCCGTQYAEYCCKFSLINLTTSEAVVPGLPGMKPYGLDNAMSISGRGPINDGRIIPHISAPGMISSARSRNEECNLDDPLQNMVLAREGSSVAAGHVAALVGIIRQYFRNGYYPTKKKNIGKKFGGFKWSRAGEDDFTPSAAMVKAMLLVCAVPLRGVVHNRAYTKQASWSKIDDLTMQWGSAAPSYAAGMGRPQLNQCLPLPADPFRLILGVTKVEVNQANRLELFEPTMETLQKKSFCFTVLSNRVPLRVAVAWTDPPGQVQSHTHWNSDQTNSRVMNSEKVLVNDIDLNMLGGGQNRTGNEIFRPHADTGILEPQYDRENNFEFILVPTSALVSGHKYQVIVSGFAIQVESDPVKAEMGQRYSVVVVGDVTDQSPGNDKENCPACAPGKIKNCVVPKGCSGLECQGRGTQQCDDASQYADCMDITCYEGYVPIEGAPPDNFCVNYTKTVNRYMLRSVLRLAGNIDDFASAHFEATAANFFKVTTNRVTVTDAVAGSVVASFDIMQNGTNSEELYEFQETILGRRDEVKEEERREGLTDSALGSYFVEEVIECTYYDSLPPPPPCDLDFWVIRWCDAKYWSMWITIWIGCFVILLGLAVYVIKRLREYYDKSLTRAQARQSIKMALTKNAMETVAWATKDKELVDLNYEQYQYVRLGEFFRVWAFFNSNITRDVFIERKLFAKAFLYWKDKFRVPGMASQNDRAWDMMMISKGKLGLAVDMELKDFGKKDLYEDNATMMATKQTQYADFDTSNQENTPLKCESDEEIAILDTPLEDDDIELMLVGIEEYGTNFPSIFDRHFNGQRPYAQEVVLDCYQQLIQHETM